MVIILIYTHIGVQYVIFYFLNVKQEIQMIVFCDMLELDSWRNINVQFVPAP